MVSRNSKVILNADKHGVSRWGLFPGGFRPLLKAPACPRRPPSSFEHAALFENTGSYMTPLGPPLRIWSRNTMYSQAPTIHGPPVVKKLTNSPRMGALGSRAFGAHTCSLFKHVARLAIPSLLHYVFSARAVPRQNIVQAVFFSYQNFSFGRHAFHPSPDV